MNVEEYLAGATHWRSELTCLRKTLLATGLAEAVKWGAPVYTHQGKNVVGIGGFKSYFGLWFFQGALLEDPRGVLVQAQEGRTKALRQLRFTSAKEIDRRLIRAYVRQAILLVEQGVEIRPVRSRAVQVPAELEAALARRTRTRQAFDRLTPGKRREYAEHVADAKRPETRRRRVERIVPMIEAGVGLNDRYRGC